ncbi:hypothetical protein F511_36832 [Dorcoceras hygrometricum]|uniref:Uncharacterized protein n=1 Tax=Dorcoceras hygrometricum TaxID=472368 RepID=A0A2Z7B0Y1_9LAMI|nr:hypothetical protein F511_36832 [Dorcoceras hygrometricum]
MPPIRRGRATRQIRADSEGRNEEGQRSIPVRRRARQIEDEVGVLAARVDEMKLIMARFQHLKHDPDGLRTDSSQTQSELVQI